MASIRDRNKAPGNPAPQARKWTEPQRQAIETVGQSLLVSAAAGSGKTSVLAERCVRLILDAVPPCAVGELLVVTFTEKAATEMKERIAKRLAERHADSPGPRTAKQLAMFDRANISTLHGFCSRLLRQNFHLLGLDPEFRILDADEASMLKLDIARELFAERYDSENGEAFRRLIDSYGDGEDERLIRQVHDIYDTLCSIVDSGGWLRRARENITEAIELPLPESALGRSYISFISGQLNSVMAECGSAGIAVKAMSHFQGYTDLLRDVYRTLLHWTKVLNTHGIDALAEEATAEFPNLPRVAGSLPGKELAQKRVNEVRRLVRDGAWRQCLSFSTEEWKDGLGRTLPHVDALISLVVEFTERYTRAKDEEGVLDFADLECLALRALKIPMSLELNPSSVAKAYHAQFKHVLVDEYQDINEVQDAILTLVSRECIADHPGVIPNLFCVGDVKQSIYRFRLAEPARFLARRERYLVPHGHGRVIDLKQNFRSRAPLLETINAAFERLMTKASADLDYDDSQKLVPALDFPATTDAAGFLGAPIEMHLLSKDSAEPDQQVEEELDRSEREAVVVGRLILDLLGRTGGAHKQVVDRAGPTPVIRPMRYSDVVVLMRSMKFKADAFAETLRGMGIPVHTESVTGYFEATEINDVLSLLHVLDNQRQDIPLAALLRSPLFTLPDVESSFARIRLAYQGDPPVPFHLAVQEYAEEKTDELSEHLRRILGTLERWRQTARQRPVAELLWSIYNETAYLAFNAGLPDGEQRQANLIDLHDRAKQFSTFRRQGLTRFTSFLEKLKKDADLGQAPIVSEADDVVRIMSIHKSKGLEFPVVFLPDLGKAINQQDSQGSILFDRVAGLGLQVVDEHRQIRYPSLASTVVQQRIRQQTLAEELRVLYVAMTRAKEHLVLIGTTTDAAVKAWQDRWANHTGPVPAETVLAARTALDWLGPVATILPSQLTMHTHTSKDIESWSTGDARRPKYSAAQQLLADLKPLDVAVEISSEARAVIDRLGQDYRYADVATRPASASVTSLVKNTGPPGVSVRVAVAPSSTVRGLDLPAFLSSDRPPNAADRGTATHAVLEHFNFASDASDIETQIRKMVEDRKLTQASADEVDVPAIAWFLQSEVGQLVRARAGELRRELPVYFSDESVDAVCAMDKPMVRGRIDLLVPTDRGWLIVDYKTDRVTGDEIETRTGLYAAQLRLYRQALHRITGQTAGDAVVVYLHPREIRTVSD